MKRICLAVLFSINFTLAYSLYNVEGDGKSTNKFVYKNNDCNVSDISYFSGNGYARLAGKEALL